MGVITLFNSVLNYLSGAYPEYAASAFAGNGLMRAPFDAAFPSFVCFLELDLAGDLIGKSFI